MPRSRHLLLRGGLVSLVIIGSGLLFSFLQQQPTPAQLIEPQHQKPATEPVQPSVSPQELYLLINGFRAAEQLPQLRNNPRLEASAQLKLDDMLENHYYRHEDVTGQQSWHFIKQANYQYRHAGENLAFRLDSAWKILESWQQSPVHKEQLLHPAYEEMGVAIDCQALQKYADGGCITVLHLGSE